MGCVFARGVRLQRARESAPYSAPYIYYPNANRRLLLAPLANHDSASVASMCRARRLRLYARENSASAAAFSLPVSFARNRMTVWGGGEVRANNPPPPPRLHNQNLRSRSQIRRS